MWMMIADAAFAKIVFFYKRTHNYILNISIFYFFKQKKSHSIQFFQTYIKLDCLGLKDVLKQKTKDTIFPNLHQV